GWSGEGLRARRARVVAEAEPEDDGARDPVRRPQAAGDAVDESGEICVEGLACPRRSPERVLRADRAPAPPCVDRTRIEVVRERVEVVTRRAAEHRDEDRLRQIRNLPHGGDAALAELA